MVEPSAIRSNISEPIIDAVSNAVDDVTSSSSGLIHDYVWRRGLVVGTRPRELEVAGSSPGCVKKYPTIDSEGSCQYAMSDEPYVMAAPLKWYIGW